MECLLRELWLDSLSPGLSPGLLARWLPGAGSLSRSFDQLTVSYRYYSLGPGLSCHCPSISCFEIGLINDSRLCSTIIAYPRQFVKGDETASSRASCDRGHLPAYRQVTVYRLWFVLSQATTCRLRARLQRGQNQANLLSVSEKQIGLLHREHSADGASAVLAPLCRAVGRPWLVSTFSRWVREGASATGQPERAFGRRFARGERGRVHAWLGG